MRDLIQTAKECMQELDTIRVPYKTVTRWNVNTKAKHCWGSCKAALPHFAYHIEINHKLLDERVPLQSLKKVIIHELLHTVDGGMSHTGIWKQYANKVYNKLGYDITRTDSEDDLNIPNELRNATLARNRKNGMAYILQCNKCGYEAVLHKMCESVRHPEHRTHIKCGGYFKRVEI